MKMNRVTDKDMIVILIVHRKKRRNTFTTKVLLHDKIGKKIIILGGDCKLKK